MSTQETQKRTDRLPEIDTFDQVNLSPLPNCLKAGLVLESREKSKRNFLTDFIPNISGRLQRIREVENHDRIAKKLLISEAFINGQTLIHGTQIKYLKDMISTMEDSQEKISFEEQLKKMEISFEILKTYKEFIVNKKFEIDGGEVVENKKQTNIGDSILKVTRKLFWAGVPATFATAATMWTTVFSGVLNSSTFFPILGTAYGTVFAGKLAFDEIRKLMLNREFRNKLKSTLNLQNWIETEDWGSLKKMHDNAPTKRKSYQINDRKISKYYYQYNEKPLENPTLTEMYAFYDNRVAELKKHKKT